MLAADLGLDEIRVWRFDDVKGTLTANEPPSVALPPGDGPRHFAFHPNGRWLYSLQEEASTIVTFDFDPSNGRSTENRRCRPCRTDLQAPTSHPRSRSHQMRVSCTSRTGCTTLLPGSRSESEGTLTWVGEEWTRGDYPRSFTFDPSGGFLFSCNQRSDAITSFRIDRRSGALTFTGHYTPVGSPAHIIFLR